MVGNLIASFWDGFRGGCELLVSGSSTMTTKELIPSRRLTYPTWEKENHLQNAIFGRYVSFLEGRCSMQTLFRSTGIFRHLWSWEPTMTHTHTYMCIWYTKNIYMNDEHRTYIYTKLVFINNTTILCGLCLQSVGTSSLASLPWLPFFCTDGGTTSFQLTATRQKNGKTRNSMGFQRI